jgi:polysaccharide export outer membrane protein
MAVKNKFGFLVLIGMVLLIQSCGVNSNIMFKSPKGEHAHSDSIPMQPIQDYQISVDDKLAFTLATNNGTKIIESMSGINQQGGGTGSATDYVVRRSGKVELPILGEVMVAGLTVAQCEDTLQRLFSKEYQDPFVQVRVTNQRVIVFPGNGSDAKVIPLLNSNTTLMEAIAQAGGITERGKANTIKLMRKENGIRKIYTFDLSTVEGLKHVDMIVQANDYIYIEPTAELAQGVVREVAPVISILSSALVIFTVFSKF